MKVLLINGSPREHGNTFTALSEVAKTLHVRHGLQRSHARRSLTENRKIILAKKRLTALKVCQSPSLCYQPSDIFSDLGRSVALRIHQTSYIIPMQLVVPIAVSAAVKMDITI